MNFRLREWWRRFAKPFGIATTARAKRNSGSIWRWRNWMRCAGARTVREARLRAGGVAQAAEAVRDQGTIRWLSDFLRDSRHGIRLLGRSPLFTAAAIVSLALGIGANTAIFSLMDAVILRMMPVHEPERLVQFGRDLSYPLFRQFGQELHCFTDMFAHSSMGRRDVIFDEEPEAVSAERRYPATIIRCWVFPRLPDGPLIPRSIGTQHRLRSLAMRTGSGGSPWIRP